MKKKYSTIILYLFLFIYLEAINKILMFNKLLGKEFLIVILFSLSLSCLLSFFTHFFREKTNRRISTFFVVLIIAFYLFNFLYYSLFSVPFSMNDLELANNALSFYQIALHLIQTDFLNILIFLIPLFMFLIYKNDFDFTRKHKKIKLKKVIFVVFFYLLSILSLNLDKTSLYSPYNLYYNLNSITTSTEVLGVFTSQRLSMKRYLFGFEEKLMVEEVEEINEEVSYNKLDIDFDTLIKEEKDESVKNVYRYLNAKKATNQNEYTGMYKGKNLIFILAEGFNSIAVDEARTPTLYKLIHEGFDFTNYYSPEFLSTTGGEFQAMSGLLPSQEILSIWRNQHPTLSYAIGNAFKNIGYNAQSYHNWFYKYYSRQLTMPTLGFDNYIACRNGLEKRMNCSWLPSDVDMINQTFDDYASISPFVTYYITVSGHAPYNFMGGNRMAIKNKNVVKDLPYSTPVKAYLAAQMELEYALQTLIEKLENAGILEDTVIVLTGDHYPYTLTEDEINEVSTYKREELVEVHHSNLIIWNTNNEHKVVEKVASQIDVLPTILNLFGIEYDSRLLIGQDIFSDEEGLAIFASRSWRSDKGTYFSNKEFEGANVSNDYIEYMNKRIANSFTISKLMLEKDIYSKLEKAKGE